MHELSAVNTLVRTLLQRFDKTGGERVVSVKVRLGGSFTEETLLRAFQLLTHGTPLSETALVVETARATIACRCGAAHQVNLQNHFGPLFICPSCGDMRTIELDDELKLVEVTVETPDVPATD